jgi:hypothetical protein
MIDFITGFAIGFLACLAIIALIFELAERGY